MNDRFVDRLSVKFAVVATGLPRLVAPFLAGRGAILMFHRIGDDGLGFHFDANRRNIVSSGSFAGLLDWLAQRQIDVVDLDEGLRRLAMSKARRFVCLTFDDGYVDNATELPGLLETRGVPATVYVSPGLLDGTATLWWYVLDRIIAARRSVQLRLDRPTELPTDTTDRKQAAFDRAVSVVLNGPAHIAAAMIDDLAQRYEVDVASLARAHMMTWDDVRALSAHPLVEIGAHTLTHPSLATLDERSARREMEESRSRLESETGVPVRHFAYPFGTSPAIGRREAVLAKAMGVTTAVTACPGGLRRKHIQQTEAWPRYGVGPDDGPSALRLKLAGLAGMRGRLLHRGALTKSDTQYG